MKTEYIEGLGGMYVTEVFSPTDNETYYRVLQFDFPDLSHTGFDKYTEFLNERIASAESTANSNAIAMIYYPATTPIDRPLAEHMITLLAARMLLCAGIKWSMSVSEKSNAGSCRIDIFYLIREQKSGRDDFMDSLLRNSTEPIAKQKRPNLWSRLLKRLGWCRCVK